MEVQSGILKGITSISSNDQTEQEEYITEVPADEEARKPAETVTVSENAPEEGTLQYIIVESGEGEPLEVMDYTSPLAMLCLFAGICAGCLFFLAFGRGLTHGD